MTKVPSEGFAFVVNVIINYSFNRYNTTEIPHAVCHSITSPVLSPRSAKVQAMPNTTCWGALPTSWVKTGVLKTLWLVEILNVLT